MSAARPRSGAWLDAPVWSAGFRPFFLAGAIYGPLAILYWLATYMGIADGPMAITLWHSHELLCGYGAAVITGFVITGIPSWGECKAIDRGPLAVVFGVWLAGRIAMWLTGVLPPELIAVIDLAFFPVLAVAILPGLSGSRYKAFYAVLPILAAFFYGNLLFHLGAIRGDQQAALFGLRFFLYAIVVLYTIVGGLLAPIFTETELREAGWRGRIGFIMPLEIAAIASVLAYAATGLYAPESTLSGTVALITLVIHSARMARWQSHRTAGQPLLWVIHLSYAWFLVSVGLRAAGDLWGMVPAMAAVHAFTVGAFGLMKIGFLTRVALRHTGRAPRPHGAMVMAFGLMFLAAATRTAAAQGFETGLMMTLSTALWALPFVIYLMLYGGLLIRPSLPYSN